MAILLSEWPELTPAAFCDITLEGPVPSYSILPDSEVARRYAEAAIRSELELYELAADSIRRQSISPSTLSRGSP